MGMMFLGAGYPYGELFSDTIKAPMYRGANKGVGDDSGQFQMDAATSQKLWWSYL